MRSFFRKLLWLVRRDTRESDLRDELQFHLEEESADRIADSEREEPALADSLLPSGVGSALRDDRRRSRWSLRLDELERRSCFRSLCVSERDQADH